MCTGTVAIKTVACLLQLIFAAFYLPFDTVCTVIGLTYSARDDLQMRELCIVCAVLA